MTDAEKGRQGWGKRALSVGSASGQVVDSSEPQIPARGSAGCRAQAKLTRSVPERAQAARTPAIFVGVASKGLSSRQTYSFEVRSLMKITPGSKIAWVPSGNVDSALEGWSQCQLLYETKKDDQNASRAGCAARSARL